MDDETLIAAVQPKFEEYEGRSPWLYLDHLGHLTIGIGHLVYRCDHSHSELEAGLKRLFLYGMTSLRTDRDYAVDYATYCTLNSAKTPGPVRARKLKSVQSLLRRIDVETGEIELLDETKRLSPGVWGFELPEADGGGGNLKVIAQEAEQILELPRNWRRPIEFFECFNSYRLSEAAIDLLFQEDVQSKLKELRAEKPFTKFDDFPEAVQAAVLDLAFQGGAHGLAGQSAFAKAVSDQDWAAAAKVKPFPYEGTAQKERTAYRKKLLETAAPARNSTPNLPPRNVSPGPTAYA